MSKIMTILRTKTIAAIAFIIMAFAGVLDSTILHILGMCVLIVSLFLLTRFEAILLTVIFTPNLALLTLSTKGLGLIGFVYLALFMKMILISRVRLRIKKSIFIPFLYLISLTSTRFFSGNYYDFFIIIEVFLILFTWDYILDVGSIDLFKYVFDAYGFGCVLLLIGMFINLLGNNASLMRMTAIQDDANFCSMAFIVLFSCALNSFTYKLDVRHSILYIIISLIGGAATGSRGFFVALVIVLSLFVLVGTLSRNARKAVYLVIFLVVFGFVMYLLRVSAFVNAYDNTINRTLQLRNTYRTGDFMDVSSGRFFLWKYYIDYIRNNKGVLIWGRGFKDYYLTQNGGYSGMSAHNSYIASIIGVGIIGSILLMIAYISLLRGRLRISKKQGLSFLSIAIGTTVGYFFLDGILDLRLIMSFVMTGVMCRIYTYDLNNNAYNGGRIE